MEIISVDPGKMTGMAWWIDGEHGAAEVAYAETGPAVARFIRLFPETYVVCENFYITRETAKKSAAPWSLKLIGVVDYLCYINGLFEPVMQSPGDAKNFSTDPRLKVLGWYKGSGGGFAGHADDASRHLLLYLAKNRLIDLKGLVDV